MLLSAEIDDERSTTGALSASVSSCHFCVAHSHSPRPFYSKHHAKLEEKINLLLKSTIGNSIYWRFWVKMGDNGGSNF